MTELLDNTTTLTGIDLDDEILTATEDDIRAITSVCSFDHDKLSVHIAGDPFQQMLHGHLYLDHILTQMLAEEFKNPKAVDLGRTSFSQKLSLVDAMGLMPRDLVRGVAGLNRLRNRLAHDLSATIGDSEVQKLISVLPGYLQKEVRSAKHEKGTLYVIIVHLIFSVENARQNCAYRRLHLKQWHMKAREFLRRAGSKERS